MTRECACGQPTAGAWLCPRCEKTLRVSLGKVADHYADMETVRARQTRYGVPGKGAPGKTMPLPVDLRFVAPSDATERDEWQIPGREGRGTAAMSAARNTITTWVRTTLDEFPPLAGPTCTDCLHLTCHEIKRRTHPRDNIGSCCDYLERMLHTISARHWAPQMLAELLTIESELRRIVDRPPELKFLGVCPECQESVYAVEHAVTGTCRGCGAEYDTEASRLALTDALDDQLLTAAEIASMSTYLGLDAPRERIRMRVAQWHKRGRIAAAGHDERGHPRFAYRDVRPLLFTEFTTPSSA